MERLGKYELIQKIAAGGMAEVFLANVKEPDGSSKRVAVKRLFDHLTDDPTAVTRFFDEARLSSQLVHPNIARVLEFSLVEGTYFIVMELVDGLSIDRLLQLSVPPRPVSSHLTAEIGRQVCEALAYAHGFHDGDGKAVKVIHRDISPQNIVISYDGVVKLLDFGIAKAALNLYQTHAGSLHGKPAYMSPEQISQNSRLDHRSDLFSLGIVLFELVTGQQPFGGNTDLNVMRSILSDPMPDPMSFNPDVAPGFCTILARTLMKDPKKRYADARAMAKDIEEFLESSGATRTKEKLSAFARNVAVPETIISEMIPKPEIDGATMVDKALPAVAPSPATEPTIIAESSMVIEPTIIANPSVSASHRVINPVVVIPERRATVPLPPWFYLVVSSIAAIGMIVAVSSLFKNSETETNAPLAGSADTQPKPTPNPDDVTEVEAVPNQPPPTQPLPEPPRRANAPPKRKGRQPVNRVRQTDAPKANDNAPAPAPAFVQIDTRPWTYIRIDDVDYGPTPIGQPIQLPPGAHRIRFANPEEGIDHEETLKLAPGQHASVQKKF